MSNEIKRTYNVQLRREYLKVPRYERSKKAMKALKLFIQKHMKVEEKDLNIGKFLNEEIWKHGIKNPPHHIKINVLKDVKENKVIAELFGKDIKFEKKKEKKEGIADKVKEKLGVKDKSNKKVADKKEDAKSDEKEVLAELKGEELKEKLKETLHEHAEEAKEVEHEEIEEMKKELPKAQHKHQKQETGEKRVEHHNMAPKHV